MNLGTYLEVGSIVLCDIWGVTLTQHLNFLLDVLNFILSLFQINNLYCNNLKQTEKVKLNEISSLKSLIRNGSSVYAKESCHICHWCLS